MTGGGIRAARNLSATTIATIAARSSYYHIVTWRCTTANVPRSPKAAVQR
jgi:hypothetical protein